MLKKEEQRRGSKLPNLALLTQRVRQKEEMMKILVVHPAQQHSYRLATALEKKGWLYKYLTTVYWKKYSFTRLAAFFLKGNFKKKAMLRHCAELNDRQVVQFCEIEGLLKLLAMNTARLRPFYKRIKYHTADRFARKAARYAIKEKVDAVISYDDSSSLLFSILERKAPDILRVMDVSAANILYMRQIYDRDIKRKPAFANRLKKEREIVWNPDNIKRAETELRYTQVFLAPSEFVARSLKFSGVQDEQIKICPYGVDVDQFAEKNYRKTDELVDFPLRFIYVGGVKELKGIGYLLEAISRFSESKAELTVVGQYDPSDPAIMPYLKRVRFTGSVLHDEVAELLRNADVFVFPSLGEGLSLSALEAAACGLPLIVTENSGVNDAMIDGREGFIIPIQSSEALVEKMEWFFQHPERMKDMGRAARKMALSYTWENYYQRVGEIFDEINEAG